MTGLLSASVLAITTVFALTFSSYVPGELLIIRYIYSLGDVLWLPMVFITQFGSPFLLMGVSIALIILHQYRFGLKLIVGGGVTYIFIVALKFIIDRQRPFIEVTEVISRELSVTGNGFPSGHSAIAAYIAWSLWFVVGKKTKAGMIILVVMVGLSRVYLGVHSPLDVVGGYAAGVLIASLIHFVPSVLHTVKSS